MLSDKSFNYEWNVFYHTYSDEKTFNHLNCFIILLKYFKLFNEEKTTRVDL